MKKMLWSILGVVGMSVVAHGESFEAPKYQSGQSIDKADGWVVVGEGTVTDTQSAEGEQAVQVNAGAKVSRSVKASDLRFIDFTVLPTYSEGDQPQASVNAAGTRLGFVKSGSSGQITVISGTGTQGTAVQGNFPINAEGNLGQEWVRFTVRQDLKAGTWDLYLDGKPTVINQALAKDRSQFQIDNAAAEALYFDFYEELTTNPLFADTDGDGMPDAYEVGNGLNAYGDDRNGDLDGDGAGNVEEFLTQTSPRAPGSEAGIAILYVDNLRGDDGNTGKSSYSVGGDGPKASIKTAMAAAPSKAIIVIMPGTGVYKEGSRGEPDKDLIIRTLRGVVIK